MPNFCRNCLMGRLPQTCELLRFWDVFYCPDRSCPVYTFFSSSGPARTPGRIFTARRVCIAQTMPRQDVRPSVSDRLSHAGILWTPLNISSFLPSGSSTTVVFFHTERDGNISTRTLNRGVECKGYEKNHDF